MQCFFLKENGRGYPHGAYSKEMVSHPGFEPWVGAPQSVAFTTPTVSPLTHRCNVATYYHVAILKCFTLLIHLSYEPMFQLKLLFQLQQSLDPTYFSFN